MVYKKTPNHVSYAERVLGAYSQVQREHRKRSVHLATLRAQVKKNAQAKKDKLGPNWVHFVGKAVVKLENEGIFHHTGAVASVSLTPTGKKTIANARRVIKNSGETPESQAQDDRVWKEVASLGTKRSRRQSKVGGYISDDTEEQATPARVGAGRKRPRLSTPPVKKPKNPRQVHVHELLRGISPLTDLDSEDELREGNDVELDEMRPEQTPSTAENEADGNIRYATPPAIHLDRPSSPISPTNRLLSRNYCGGIVRTQSGSIIPNLSKQPTPAPSSPDRDLDGNERNLGTPNYELDIDTFQPSASTPSYVPAGTGSLNGRAENPLIVSLNLEIKNLQQQLLNAGNAATAPEQRTAGNIAGVEKVMFQLESAIAERDATVSALREENESLQADVNYTQDSWEKVSSELKAAESLIEELRVEREVALGKVQALEVSNEELVRGQAELQDLLALARAESSEAKGLNDLLRSQCDDLTVEIDSLKRREAEGASRNHSLDESLSRITNEAQGLRDQNAGLELLISKYREEAQEKDTIARNLRSEVNVKDIRIEGLSVQLKESAEESSVRISQKQSAIAALSEEILTMQENAKTLEEALATKLDELKTEKSQLTRQLADRERGLQAAQHATTDACVKIEKLTLELTLKENSIQQFLMEVEDARGHVMTAEGNLAESRERYEKERTVLLTQVSDLQASLETVKGQSDALVTDMRAKNAQAVEKDKGLTELQHALELERRGKSALETGMASYIRKIQDLETQLAEVENAKKLEQMKIFDLRKSFESLRKSQEKVFEEFEGGIVTAQPSSEQRIAAPP